MSHASRLLPLVLLIAACAALITSATAPSARADDGTGKPRLVVLPFAVSGWDARLGDGIAAQLDDWDGLTDHYAVCSRTHVNGAIRELEMWIEDATTASYDLCEYLDSWLVLEGSIDKVSDAHVLLSVRLVEVDREGGMTVLASGASESGTLYMKAVRDLVASVLDDAAGAGGQADVSAARATVSMTLPSAFANEAVHIDKVALTRDIEAALEQVARLTPRFQFQIALAFPEDRISSMFGVVIMCACVATCDVVARDSGRVVDSFTVVDEIGETFEIAAARIAGALPKRLIAILTERLADELSGDARRTIECGMPGTWYARPQGGTDSQWREVGVTPGSFEVVVTSELGFVAAAEADPADAEVLIELRTLYALNLQACGLTDETAQIVAECTSLRALLVSGPITDDGVARLVGLADLTMLELYDCDAVTDDGVASVGELAQLEVLSLPNCDGFDGSGLARLNAATIKTLTLFGCSRLTDGALAALAGWPALQSIDLENSPWLTDAGVAHLAAVPALRRIDLEACGAITDAAVAGLDGLSSLRTLDLSNCGGLQSPMLTRLNALRALDLSGCANLTSIGLDDTFNVEVLFLRGCAKLDHAALDTIASLVLLRTLDLTGCVNVSEEDVESLRTRLPECTINF